MLAGLLLVVALVGSPSQALLPGYIEIVGKDTPMDIPDWLAWKNAFQVLSRSADDPESVVYSILDLRDDQRKAVSDVAKVQNARWDACIADQQKLWERFKEVERDRTMKLHQQSEIRCRTDVLRAKDALMYALGSNEGSRLKRFVEEVRSGITVQVSKLGLEHFRRPR